MRASRQNFQRPKSTDLGSQVKVYYGNIVHEIYKYTEITLDFIGRASRLGWPVAGHISKVIFCVICVDLRN